MSWFSREKEWHPDEDPIKVGETVIFDVDRKAEVIDLTEKGLPVIIDPETGQRVYVPEERIGYSR